MDANNLYGSCTYPNPLYHRYNGINPGYYSEYKEENRNYDYDDGNLNPLDNPIQTEIITNPLFGKPCNKAANEIVSANSSTLTNPKYINYDYDNGYFNSMDSSAGIKTIDASNAVNQNTNQVPSREQLAFGIYTDYV